MAVRSPQSSLEKSSKSGSVCFYTGAGFAAELVQTLAGHLGLHQRENAFWKIPPVSQWLLSMIFFSPTHLFSKLFCIKSTSLSVIPVEHLSSSVRSNVRGDWSKVGFDDLGGLFLPK